MVFLMGKVYAKKTHVKMAFCFILQFVFGNDVFIKNRVFSDVLDGLQSVLKCAYFTFASAKPVKSSIYLHFRCLLETP